MIYILISYKVIQLWKYRCNICVADIFVIYMFYKYNNLKRHSYITAAIYALTMYKLNDNIPNGITYFKCHLLS